jgi:hypothetical protein
MIGCDLPFDGLRVLRVSRSSVAGIAMAELVEAGSASV